ncbi:MAG: ATP-binding cassette domain-containing protein [Anaerolineales bacterium]
MATIEVEGITKSFNSRRVVDEVSFSVEAGEIFGLLGPNGAGKTTTIRIILDIFKPDSGRVAVLGGAMNTGKLDRIGYLPEERGLYQETRLEETLVYLATLKGLSKAEAKRRVAEFLEKFELAEHKKKKVRELSKGMQQKAQLIATLVHKPDLVIVDEPFSALDPINTQMVKELLREEKQRGTTVVMCSHQMHQVQELCDRVLLIHQGRVMLYGQVDETRRRFAGREVLISPSKDLPPVMPGVETVTMVNGGAHLTLNSGVSPQQLLRWLVEQKITVEHFETVMPSLDEIFIRVVQNSGMSE